MVNLYYSHGTWHYPHESRRRTSDDRLPWTTEGLGNSRRFGGRRLGGAAHGAERRLAASPVAVLQPDGLAEDLLFVNSLLVLLLTTLYTSSRFPTARVSPYPAPIPMPR
jgi:hypothetical protein